MAFRILLGRILFGLNIQNACSIIVFVRSDWRTIIVHECNGVLIHNRLELCIIHIGTFDLGEFTTPAIKDIGVLSISFLNRSFAIVLGSRSVFPFSRFQFIVICVVEGHRILAERTIPHHLVRGVRCCRNNFRSKLPTKGVFMRFRGGLIPVITVVTFRYVASNNYRFVHKIFTIHKGNGVHRDIEATHVINFKDTFSTRRGLNIPVKHGRAFHHICNIYFNSPTVLLPQLRSNNHSLGFPCIALRNTLHVIIVADIIDRTDSKVVP